MKPAEELHAIYKANLRHVWPHGTLDHATLTRARALYELLGDAEKREAFYPYKRHRIDLGAPPPLSRATFIIGDSPAEPWIKVDGWDTGDRWNGWAKPLVDIVALRAFVKQQTALGFEGNDTRYVMDEDLPGVQCSPVEAGDFDPYAIEGDMVLCDDGETRHLFDIGLGLIWERAS